MSERDVIGQVDALIGRHRTPGATEDDLPILTEVVADDDALPPSSEPAPRQESERIAIIRQALARELEAWLDEELPDAVLRVLDGLSDQLIAQVAARARLELLPRLKAALEDGNRDV